MNIALHNHPFSETRGKLPWWTHAGEEHPLALAARIAARFQVTSPLEAYEFPDKGNINQHTFVIVSRSPEGRQEFLLQRINRQVFTRPAKVMAAMIACIQAQKNGIDKKTLPPGRIWETITLQPTLAGDLYLEQNDRHGSEYWRLMIKISDCMAYKSLSEIPLRQDQIRIAEEAGRGLALFGDFSSDIDTSDMENPLPGYRDTKNYYQQLKSVLAGNRNLQQAAEYLPEDPILRQSTEQHFLLHLSEKEYRRRLGMADLQPFIAMALQEESFAMTLLDAMRTHRIRRTAIHGDTKLDNFLFCRHSGRVKALVDLDTIMPHTWLADWGDMVRSLSNVAGEKESNPDRIQVDMDIYHALARGFLSLASQVKPEEIALMADAVEIIALELGVRFLADYLRGDSYFKLCPADPPDLNKIRAIGQLTLFRRLRQKAGEIRAFLQP